eukprot:771270-Pyramimonas_sp.AAC.1
MARRRRQMPAKSSEDSSRGLLQGSETAPESAKIGRERPQMAREGSKTASSEVQKRSQRLSRVPPEVAKRV